MLTAVQTGPASDSTASYFDSDLGKYVHTIRQSTLSTFSHQCARQVQLTMRHPERNVSTSQQVIGTAAHAAIEVAINAWLDGNGWIMPADMMAVGKSQYESLSSEPNFVQNNDSDAKCLQLIWEFIEKWVGQVRPHLHPQVSEATFKGLVLHEDEHRIIRANGTIDYVDEAGWIGDWKTSSRTWTGSGGNSWEKVRWDIQSRLYPWAALQMNLDLVAAPRFTFVVGVHGNPAMQFVDINYDPRRVEWVKQLAMDWAEINESELLRWPRNDGHALCSPTWCPHYSECKGLYVPDIRSN